MKNRTRTLQVLLGLLLTLGASNAQTTFERVRAQLAEAFTVVEPDGSVRYAKQFERWQWFWKARLTPQGEFGSPEHYLRELQQVRSFMQKRAEDVQALPTWKELGPVAPDLPSENNVWNGIGRVNTVNVSPADANFLLLGSAQGGLWQSTNGGTGWTHLVIPDMPLFGVSDIQFAPNNAQVIYVATGDVNASIPGSLSGFPGFSYGVIKSTDGGKTWARTGLTLNPAQTNLVSRLWVDPRNADVVVAATYSGILKSTDGGQTWTGKSVSQPFRDMVGNPQSFDILYASTFQNFTGGAAIYRSTDAGETWTSVLSLPDANRIRLAVTKADPSMVGAVASEVRKDNTRRYNGLEGVYRSRDFGASFENMNVGVNLLGWNAAGNDLDGQGFYDLAMTISPTNANIWMVGGINVWRSTNAGSSWVLSAHWFGQGAPWVHADHHFLLYHPTVRRVYACNDGGIARSNDDGVSWRDMSNGLKIQQYYGLAVSDQSTNITLAGAQDNGTARTLDGQSFLHTLDGDGMMTAIDAKNSTIMYASQPYGTFYRSTNSGSNWQRISRSGQHGESGGAWVAPIAVDPSTSNTVYVGYSQVYKSVNAGGTWTRISQFDGLSSYLRHIAVSPANGNYMVAANDDQVFATTNGGSSWTQLPGISGYIQDLACHPTDPDKYWITFGGFVASTKIFEVDGGQITNITGTGLPNVPANAVTFQAGIFDRIYVGTDEGVFFKDASVDTWVPYGAGMPTTVISGMEYLPSVGKIRVSTYGRGIWEVDAVQCRATKPSISVKDNVVDACQGENTITLTAPAGFERYAWSNGETTRSIELVTFNQTGSYNVTVDDANGCRATSDPVAVTIKRAPARPNITLKDPTTLRSSAIGGITQFQWFFEGTAIPGATEREYSPTMPGIYTVQVFNDEGCATMSNDFAFGEIVSVQDGASSSVRLTVQPNPFTDNVSVSLPPGSGRQLQFVDLTGAVVMQMPLADHQEQAAVSVSGLANGLYVVRVLGADQQWSTTVVKR